MTGSALAWLRGQLFTMGPLSDLLVWTVVWLFALAAGVEWYGRRSDTDLMSPATTIATVAWVGFGLFWLNSVPFWAFEHQSYVEAILALAGVPACFYAARELYDGRTSLFILSRAIAVMGFIYLPFETIPAISVGGLALPAPRRFLIEITTAITGWMRQDTRRSW